MYTSIRVARAIVIGWCVASLSLYGSALFSKQEAYAIAQHLVKELPRVAHDVKAIITTEDLAMLESMQDQLHSYSFDELVECPELSLSESQLSYVRNFLERTQRCVGCMTQDMVAQFVSKKALNAQVSAYLVGMVTAFAVVAATQQNLLWTAGTPVLKVLNVMLLLSALFCKNLLYPTVGAFVATLLFFRNPDRVCEEARINPAVLVCPADGKVVEVLSSENNELEGYAKKVAIFLSVTNVHVMRSPLSGSVESMKYRPGTFKPAFVPKSSELNERNDVVIKDAQGRKILVRQIAGMIARRIVWWIDVNDAINLGQRYGMIRFGSRVEVFMPEGVDIAVNVGDSVKGGETVLARWRNS